MKDEHKDLIIDLLLIGSDIGTLKRNLDESQQKLLIVLLENYNAMKLFKGTGEVKGIVPGIEKIGQKQFPNTTEE